MTEVTNEQLLNEIRDIKKVLKEILKYKKSEVKRSESKQQESTEVTEEDLERVKEAYLAVGKGRPFVRIHRVREHLGWPREKFDNAIKTLRKRFEFQLEGGDPSRLTQEQLEDSYTDEAGRLYIAMSKKE